MSVPLVIGIGVLVWLVVCVVAVAVGAAASRGDDAVSDSATDCAWHTEATPAARSRLSDEDRVQRVRSPASS